MDEQIYWNKCECNELDAMTRRHFLQYMTPAGPRPVNHYETLVSNEMRHIAKSVLSFGGKIDTVTHNTLMQHTRSNIKRRYKMAYYNIRNGRITTGAANPTIKAFVKYEKIPTSKMLANKPPRLIQFRSYEYLYQLKKHILGYDIRLKEHKDEMEFNGQTVGTIYTKMHDNYGIAAALRKNWDHFNDPIAILLDAGKFDGHYKKRNLTREHQFWRMVLTPTRALLNLLKNQIKTKGTSQNGIKFKADTNRGSGEYTTSDGNSVSMYSMLAAWLKDSGLLPNEFRISVNGDDSVVIIDRSNRNKLLPLSWFTNLNMDMESGGIVDNFCEISYCQASPIRVERDGKLVWYMVSTPFRFMSRACYAPSEYLRCVDRYLSSVGLCALAQNAGVPIVQEFALAVLAHGNYDRPLGGFDRYPAVRSGNEARVKSIHQVTRNDFEAAFGLSPQEQVVWEMGLAGSVKSNPGFKAHLEKYRNYTKINLFE